MSKYMEYPKYFNLFKKSYRYEFLQAYQAALHIFKGTN